MNIRSFSISVAAVFIVGIFPLLCIESFGSADAGVTTGFLLPLQDPYRVAGSVIIGIFSAWLEGEAILIMPLSTLLMFVIGSLTQIDEHAFYAIHGFMLGAIILFAMCIGSLQNKILFIYITPPAVLAYQVGSGYMHNIPPITTPLFFMMGTILSVVSMLAIGVSLGITIMDQTRELVVKLKTFPSFATLLSFF